MSLHVYAVTPATDKGWKKMKAVWDACKTACIDPPPEVEEYFNGEVPDDDGVVEEIDNLLRRLDSKGYDSWELSIEDIPDGVTELRIKMHY